MDRSARPYRAAALLLCIAARAGASGPSEPTPYRHPLQGAPLLDGRVAAVDVHDAPGGGRYAVVQSVKKQADGSLVRTSGVRTLDVAHEDASRRGPDELGPTGPPERIAASLARAVAAAPTSTEIDVDVRIDRSDEEPLFVTLERLIGLGAVRTEEELELHREAALDRRRLRIERRQETVAAAVRELGGRVLDRCTDAHCMTVRLTVDAVGRLAELDRVSRLRLASASPEAAGPPVSPITASAVTPVTASEVIAGMQLDQLLEHGHDGSHGGSPLTFAIVEPHLFLEEHPAFRDGTGDDSRIHKLWYCSASDCSHVGSYSPPDAQNHHATPMAGLVFGDLADGQDASVATDAARRERSGYAPEARAHFLYFDDRGRSGQKALGKIHQLQPRPWVANLSAGFEDDPKCLGESALSRVANEMFECQVLLITSAGNEGHATDSCSVTEPGAAIGVFTVGGHGTPANGSEADVRGGDLNPQSSRGGKSSNVSKRRSIVDGTAYACRSSMTDRTGGYDYDGCGTSLASATVTGAAIDYVDWYKRNEGGLIDQPGILFANLLLMGDREAELGKTDTQFDEVWGAGRLKMRRWDEIGMDGPSQWQTGHVCVGNGETVTVEVNDGQAIEADADAIKAVIYWYDVRHETGQRIDNLNLSLAPVGGDPIVNSRHTLDNKERVYAEGIGGQTLELRIHGKNVTSDRTSCGPDSMKAYYAFVYEDADRDDPVDTLADVDPL